jgi:uracil-DNA glycosylase
MKKLEKFEILLNGEDIHNNKIEFSSDTGNIYIKLASGAKNFIGTIEEEIEGVYVYKKVEKEHHYHRATYGWTINNHVLKNVNIVIYSTDVAEYRINSRDAYLNAKKFYSPEGLDKKVHVPFEAWNIRFISRKDQGIGKLLGGTWYRELREEFYKEYMLKLAAKLVYKRKQVIIHPEPEDVFNAFKTTNFGSVRVVILGNEPPYDGSSNGLAYSSKRNGSITLAAQQIFEEVERDVSSGLMLDTNPNLLRWAEQEVLLLNITLTVEDGKPMSHQALEWSNFTIQVLKSLNEKQSNVVYMFWGEFAQKFIPLINAENNLVLTAQHPSSSSSSFVDEPNKLAKFSGCKHFSKANTYLRNNGKTPIAW